VYEGVSGYDIASNGNELAITLGSAMANTPADRKLLAVFRDKPKGFPSAWFREQLRRTKDVSFTYYNKVE
jgi:hypothetical protein